MSSRKDHSIKKNKVSREPEDGDVISPMQVLWSKWHWWLYVLLIFASASALADAYLAPVQIESTIRASTSFDVNFSTRRTKLIVPWSVVTMTNGTKFQVPGSADHFVKGDTLLLEVTPLWHEVARYAKGGTVNPYWNELPATREKEYDLFLLLCCFVHCCC